MTLLITLLRSFKGETCMSILPHNNNSNPKHWKLKVFYFNRDDSRVFVPKRFGYGWTLNFAKPASYVILFAIVVIAILVAWAGRHR